MTKLPSDSFLPSGAMDPELVLSLAGLAGSPSSVVSPLSLPGGVHYFDPISRPSLTSHPTARSSSYQNPPQAQPAGFLSPHLTPIPSPSRYRLPISKRTQQRATSLSPTRYPIDKKRDGMMERTWECPAPESVPSGMPVPVDSISGAGSGLNTVRRPAPAVASGASDAQPAEQGYRKLEKLRQAFDDERRHLQANRDRAEEVHKEILDEVENDHALERARWEADKYELQKQIMQLQNRLKDMEMGSHPNLAAFQPGSSSQISPRQQHWSLSPSTSHESSSIDSKLAMDVQQPTKIIDVQEYHRDLEGIPVKESFVLRETFTDTPTSVGSTSSSGKVSPPQLLDDCRSTARAKSIHALRADADSRLTMYAGHTPTVSMSIAHTGMTNTVVSSGTTTPTLMSGDGAMSSDSNDKPESNEPAEPTHTGVDVYEPDVMEPSDEDPELKGPLTLRNLPAKDELFFKRLADKLDKVTSGEDATPTVLLRTADDDEDTDDTETNTTKPDAKSNTDGAETTEGDIELKIRTTSSNFGKPFGQA